MTGINRRQFLTAAGTAAAVAVTPPAAPAAGTDYATQGIDVSHYQGTINWASVRNSGKLFAFTKATEGLTYTDTKFAANWPAMKAAGLVRGAYHFGRPGSDAVAQADHFVNTVKPVSGDLQLVLDLEADDGKTPTQVRAWTVAFIARVKARTGRPGILYTGFYFWRDQAGNGSNLDCPLWIAQYSAAPTLIPAAWSTWTFWQYTSSGTCPGVAGNVDRDALNGGTATLNALRLP